MYANLIRGCGAAAGLGVVAANGGNQRGTSTVPGARTVCHLLVYRNAGVSLVTLVPE